MWWCCMGWLFGLYLQCKNDIKWKNITNEYIVHIICICVHTYIIQTYVNYLNIYIFVHLSSIHPSARTSGWKFFPATSGAGCVWESTQCWRSVRELRSVEGPVKSWSCFYFKADWLENMFWWFLERMLFDAYGCTFCFSALDCWFLFVFDDLQTIFLTCLMKISWNALTICLDWLLGCSSCWFCKCFCQTCWCYNVARF